MKHQGWFNDAECNIGCVPIIRPGIPSITVLYTHAMYVLKCWYVQLLYLVYIHRLDHIKENAYTLSYTKSDIKYKYHIIYNGIICNYYLYI